MLKVIKSLRFHQNNVSINPFIRYLSFESDISLKKLYPDSKQGLFTAPPPPVNVLTNFIFLFYVFFNISIISES